MIKFADSVGVQLIKATNKAVDQIIDQFAPKGKFIIEVTHQDGSKDVHEICNTVVNEGKNKIFDVMFGAVTQIATWYIGLIDNASFSSAPVTDTMSSHAGWTEWTTYSESVRQTWGVGAAASQSITNSTAATFNITASGTLKGIFVTSNSTKAGTTGTLWASALFASNLAVANGDQVKITYTVSA